jgi:hypothetical protein
LPVTSTSTLRNVQVSISSRALTAANRSSTRQTSPGFRRKPNPSGNSLDSTPTLCKQRAELFDPSATVTTMSDHSTEATPVTGDDTSYARSVTPTRSLSPSSQHPPNGVNGHSVNGNGTAYGAQQPPLTPAGVVRKKLGGYVGFASLPDQVHRRSVR